MIISLILVIKSHGRYETRVVCLCGCGWLGWQERLGLLAKIKFAPTASIGTSVGCIPTRQMHDAQFPIIVRSSGHCIVSVRWPSPQFCRFTCDSAGQGPMLACSKDAGTVFASPYIAFVKLSIKFLTDTHTNRFRSSSWVYRTKANGFLSASGQESLHNDGIRLYTHNIQKYISLPKKFPCIYIIASEQGWRK